MPEADDTIDKLLAQIARLERAIINLQHQIDELKGFRERDPPLGNARRLTLHPYPVSLRSPFI